MEINLEAPNDIADEITTVVKDYMYKAGVFFCKKLPMPADAEVSDHWVH